MVLPRRAKYKRENYPAWGERRVREAALTLSSLGALFNLCAACQIATMSCIPPSAFSASRIRETQRDSDMKMQLPGKKAKDYKFFNDESLELSPMKYSSKFMNSIWGYYNRYSPHNVKKVNDAHLSSGELQQSAANSPKIEVSLASKFESVWTSISLSQSH